MKINSSIKTLSLVRNCAMGFALASVAFSASAAPIAYSNYGTENLSEYTFTATETGDIVAYFLSKGSADYINTLGATINGVATGAVGLNNQDSSFGDSLNLGFANAGDTVVFTLNVTTTGDTWYSSKNLNSDGSNHVYSTTLSGGNLPFTGTYVAFEDLAKNLSDFNYTDEQILVTNVTAASATPTAPAVPVPAAAWLFSSGLLGLAGVTRNRRKAV
jgi:hypothetical protein